MAEDFVVPVPRDVELDLVAGLGRFGVSACTIVPPSMGEGPTVRVSRTGGELVLAQNRDQVRVLVEVWGTDASDTYQAAVRVLAAFRVFSHQQQVAPGVALHSLEVDPPRSYDDPQAPGFKRFQFSVQFITDLVDLTISE